MLTTTHRLPQFAVATLAGVLAGPAHLASAQTDGVQAQAQTQNAAPATKPEATDADSLPTPQCLAKTICALKDRLRWQSPAWSPAECQRVADGVLSSARRHHLSPTLLLAIMINESDMNEKAVRLTYKDNELYAKDSGLMGIRCVVNKKDQCTNNKVHGMSWKQLMDPVTNIETGARELAYWQRPDAPCAHKNHAFWAHYNHGPRYIEKGFPRHYPHRVAVLDHALATVLNSPAPELSDPTRITIQDKGRRPRTPDRPLESRHRKLCAQILETAGTCSALALN